MKRKTTSSSPSQQTSTTPHQQSEQARQQQQRQQQQVPCTGNTHRGCKLPPIHRCRIPGCACSDGCHNPSCRTCYPPPIPNNKVGQKRKADANSPGRGDACYYYDERKGG